ncbi:MCE family protein [Nocardioides daeguensis]|uniref:MCE family protein n=1 Tax=Nocardioides daeguensis TaxID=908359 RepID=A0ABP6UZ61_9ACTN|nr:MCE family protein [Nocardioides daeguensis]MBV6727085.1 MCE family protein [Nocardioides daeguensis]MCR1771512.1 MCE family protein [Nocardioides daeguensis]
MTRRTGLRNRFRAAAALLAGAVLLTGCDFDVYQLPLPGGADTGKDPITVSVRFDDVLDLVPKSSVKINDVAVGQVTDVRLDGYQAVVTLELRKDVDLPDNPVASIRQTSLLGEKFVSLAAPPTGAQGRLSDGDVIKDGGRNPEVEEVLGALSLVLNGGGIAQLKTISTELNLALEGREDSAKSVLTQVSSLMGQLDQRKQDIVNAIESVNRLAVTAKKHQASIDRALEELPSALDSLDRQREDLVKMLDGLTQLSDVGVRVIKTTKTATVDTLKMLDPVLYQIAQAGDDFAKGFSTFLTYPFVDDAVGRDPQVARNLHMGDYVNLSVDLQLDLGNLRLPDLVCIPLNDLPDLPLDQLVDLKTLCSGVTQTLQTCLKTPVDVQACLKLPQYLLDNVCAAVKLLCALTGGSKPAAAAGSPTAGANPLGSLLSSVLSGNGLGRPAPGGHSQADTMWNDFDAAYDADLVSLYAAPLTTQPDRQTAQKERSAQ